MCQHCGAEVAPLTNGSYRNHCPGCLWSVHVDVVPGDRASDCGALMRPDRLEQRGGKGLVVIHHCTGCGAERANRIAADGVQPDAIEAIVAVMTGRP
jgi:hypothetical protein